MPYLLYIISLLPPSTHSAAAGRYAVGAFRARPVAGVGALLAPVPIPSALGAAALSTRVRVWGIPLRIQIVGRRFWMPKSELRGSLAIRVQRRATATAANGRRRRHRRRRRRSWVRRASLQSSPGLAAPRTCWRHSDHFSLGLRGRTPCSSSGRRHYFDFGVSCECGCCRSRHACRHRSVRLRL